VNPADFRAQDRAFVERVQSYAESPGAFRNRWALAHFRFHWSSWAALALMLVALAWVAGRFGGLHLAVKGVLAVLALVAVAPLVRDFKRPQCRLCDEAPEEARVRSLAGDELVVTACHHCRVFKAESADSSLLPL
jgi:hypothetical protein